MLFIIDLFTLINTMVILSTETYEEILADIHNDKSPYSVSNLERLRLKYNTIPTDTIGSILSQEGRQDIKKNHHKVLGKIQKLVEEYDRKAKNSNNHFLLLEKANQMGISPISYARIFLHEKFKSQYKRSHINEILRNPNLVEDPILACNLTYCIHNDLLDGPVTDIIRRCIGEEYELRLKQMAKDAGLCFYDENHLRRTGFDKTPDLKLAVPVLFRKKVVHWIESKALFGSVKVHQKYIKEQLESYSNR